MAKPRPPAPHRDAAEQYVFARTALDSANAALRANAGAPAKRRKLFAAHCNTAGRRFQKAKSAARAAGLDLAGLEQAYAARRASTAAAVVAGTDGPAPPPPGVVAAEEPAVRPVATRRVTSRPRSVDALALFDPDTFGRTVWVRPIGGTFHRSDGRTVVNRDSARPVNIADARRHGMARCRHCVPSQWTRDLLSGDTRV